MSALKRFHCICLQTFALIKAIYLSFGRWTVQCSALIDFTGKIGDALDKKLFAYGIFIDLQKAFNTVNLEIILDMLRYYEAKVTANYWLTILSWKIDIILQTLRKAALKNKKIIYRVPQVPVLGPLLFLHYINDLNKSIIHSSAHHFSDDTNLLLVDKSLKKINKFVNHDSKHLSQ